MRIIHDYDGKEYLIGYVREDSDFIYFINSVGKEFRIKME